METCREQSAVEHAPSSLDGGVASLAESSAAGMREVDALLVSEDGCAPRREVVAVEMRIDLLVNGDYWASTACTPSDLTDYAYGALFSSGVIEGVEDVLSVHSELADEAIAVDVLLCADRGAAASLPRPASASKTSPATLGAVLPGYRPATGSLQALPAGSEVGRPVEPAAIWRMSRALLPAQGMHRATGATHAAVFADREGCPVLMREDVGRHNAVDKLVGAMLRAGVNPREGFVYLSSRCALELVAKCARVGVRVVATVSAPTTAVLDFAAREGVTLCAFARDGRFTVYAHPERIAL